MTTTPPDDARAERKDEWDLLHKTVNALMVAHAAGLVTCLTLIKDYKENPQLKGVGLFIGLFGVGLVTAILSTLSMLAMRKSFLAAEASADWKIGATLAVSSIISLLLLILAIGFVVSKFSTL